MLPKVLKAGYLAETKRIRTRRAQRQPRRLAAFLGRVTGVALVTKKVQDSRDRKRYAAYLTQKDELKQGHQAQRQRLIRRQELQAADVQRKLRGLVQVENRERKSLETAGRKEARQRINARYGHMPALTLELKPRGRKVALYKAKQRHISPLARELAEAARNRKEHKTIKLTEEFARTSGSEGDDGKAGDSSSSSPKPAAEQQPERRQHKRVNLTQDFKRAADDGKGKGEGGDSRSDGPKPASEKKAARRQRRKDRQDRKAEQPTRRERRKDKERDQEQQQERQRRRRRKRDLDRGRQKPARSVRSREDRCEGFPTGRAHAGIGRPPAPVHPGSYPQGRRIL